MAYLQEAVEQGDGAVDGGSDVQLRAGRHVQLQRILQPALQPQPLRLQLRLPGSYTCQPAHASVHLKLHPPNP